MGEILFLVHRIPWPPDRGDKIRSHWILRKLAALAPVHVGCFADDARDEGFANDMAGLCASMHVERRGKSMWGAGLEALASGAPVSLTSFASGTMRRWVENTLNRGSIDRVVVFSGQMAQYVPTDCDARFIMDFVDVDSAKFESYGKHGTGPMSWINRREGRLLAQFEAHVAGRANASLFVSEAEAALFRERSELDAGRVLALGNGIDAAYYDPARADITPMPVRREGPLLVFTGQMDYRPNVEAVSDFARHVLPRVQSWHGDVTFAIVGRNPADEVHRLGELPGVIVTGAVNDVRCWLQAADVVVAPLRIARGIQNKVLEAMAMARPVVASSAAAEGIDARDGTHFCVAGDAAGEAERILALLADPARAAAMGQAARAHVAAHYDWDSQLALLDDLLGDPACIVEAAE